MRSCCEGSQVSAKASRKQGWMKMYSEGLVFQLLAQQCRLKLWKNQACLPQEGCHSHLEPVNSEETSSGYDICGRRGRFSQTRN